MQPKTSLSRKTTRLLFLLGSLVLLMTTVEGAAEDRPTTFATLRSPAPRRLSTDVRTDHQLISAPRVFHSPGNDSAKPVATPRLKTPATVSSSVELRKGAAQSAPFLARQKTLVDHGNAEILMTIQPGFGQLVCNRSELFYRRNCADWRAQSCGYLRVTISF